MKWQVVFHQAFEAEYAEMALEVQDALVAAAGRSSFRGRRWAGRTPIRLKARPMPT